MLYTYDIKTSKKNCMHDITDYVLQAIKESGIQNGLCLIYCPHTTAAITINENADPAVVHDILLGLDRSFPDNHSFLHAEGNSSAHLKSSSIGCSQTLIIDNGKAILGTWQGVYLCEFDGPRLRTFHVKILAQS